jgi:zinc metalloprotease ZmpB
MSLSRASRGFLVTVVSTGLLINTAYAKKPKELNALELEGSASLPGLRLSKASAAPRMISDIRYPVAPGTAEEQGRQFLRENSELLKLKADLSDLVFDANVETTVANHAHFHQKVGDVDVLGSDITVTISRENEVVFVMSNYRPDAIPDSPHALLPARAAIGAAAEYLELEDVDAARKQTDRVVFVDADGKARFATRVRIKAPGEQLWSWEVIVDAATGKVLRAKDRTHHGKATVWDPNPVIKAGKIYGQGGLLDNNNQTSAVLTGLLTEVELTGLTATSAPYQLEGKYAVSTDFDQPRNPDCIQQTSDFLHTRDKPCFDAVNTYYFISKQMKYVVEKLGFTAAMPYQYSGGVRFDAHGAGGDDNSYYDDSEGRLAFGEGGVDDAQDHDVVLHELGHALHDWLSRGNLSQQDGLSEGMGDYFASSYSRTFMQPNHPAYNWVFSWDGHNPFWPGRVVNYAAKYPDGLTGQIHTDGQIWATALNQVISVIGKEAVDRNVLQAIAMLSSTANQNDAAAAFLKADQLNFPTGVNQDAIRRIFGDRGYTL